MIIVTYPLFLKLIDKRVIDYLLYHEDPVNHKGCASKYRIESSLQRRSA